MSALFLSLIVLTLGQTGTAQPTAAEILQRLDLNSFPNSTGPRKVDGWTYPADWSFTEASEADGVATLTNPRVWSISLMVIRHQEDGTIVCFVDDAQNGGSYLSRVALRVTGDTQTGFRAVDRVSDPSCEPVPGQD